MYRALRSALAAAVGSDPAVTCGGLSGFGAGPRGGGSAIVGPVNVPGQRVRISSLPGVRARLPLPAAGPAAPPASCSSYSATYDVFNWYLVNRANVGISTAPAPPDHTSVITDAQYWAWAAPLLQAQTPGLAGWGLGNFASIGRICRGVA